MTQSSSAQDPGTGEQPRSPWELFTTFSWLALQGFGGVLAVAQRELVERKRWLTRETFLDTYSVSQVLPGPNVVNMALMIGDRFFGWRGALAAIAGMLTIPLLIVLTLAFAHRSFADLPAVTGALRGMGAVATGLMVTMGLRMLAPLRHSPLGPSTCIALAAMTLVLVLVLRLPLVWVLPIVGTIAWAAAYRAIRRDLERR